MRLLEQKKLLEGRVARFFSRRINHSLPEHKLDCYKMIFFRCASGMLRIEESTYPLQKGAVFIIPPFVAHQLTTSEETEYVDLAVSMEYMNGPMHHRNCSFLGLDPAFEKSFGFSLYPDADLCTQVESWLERMLLAQQRNEEDLPLLFGLEFPALLLRLRRASRSPEHARSEKVPLPVIKDYLNDHFTENVTLESIAKKYSYSPSYLSRMFKEKEGFGFKEYLLQLRVEYACRLLRDGRWSANEISLMAGFSNKTFFYRCFRQKVQMTPNQFRKKFFPKY